MLLTLKGHDQLQTVVEQVTIGMGRRGFAAGDIFAVRLVMEEAIVNSIKHGNKSDPNKIVVVRCTFNHEEVVVEVEDEGAGFNPDALADPLAAENLESPGGRGVFLIRHYATWVKYNDVGNRVTFARHNSHSLVRQA